MSDWRIIYRKACRECQDQDFLRQARQGWLSPEEIQARNISQSLQARIHSNLYRYAPKGVYRYRSKVEADRDKERWMLDSFMYCLFKSCK